MKIPMPWELVPAQTWLSILEITRDIILPIIVWVAVICATFVVLVEIVIRIPELKSRLRRYLVRSFSDETENRPILDHGHLKIPGEIRSRSTTGRPPASYVSGM